MVPRPARAVRPARLVRHVDRARARARAASGCATCGRSRDGQSSDAIVVLAHRDDTGTGPGANDDASGTAALVELARGYAQAGTPTGQRVRSAHTVVFLSTDAGSFGGLGALRFAAALAVPRRRDDQPRRDRGARATTHRDHRRQPALARGLARRDGREARARADRHAGTAHRARSQQLIDLGFPFTLYEQGPFVARGIPADHLDDRPASGRRQRSPTGRRALDTARLTGARPRDAGADRLARPGPRAGAGNDELRLDRRPDRPRLGDRAVPGRSADPVPGRRRRPVRALPPAPDPAPARGAQPAHPARVLALPRARLPRRSARSARGRPVCRGRRTRLLPHQATGRCSH